MPCFDLLTCAWNTSKATKEAEAAEALKLKLKSDLYRLFFTKSEKGSGALSKINPKTTFRSQHGELNTPLEPEFYQEHHLKKSLAELVCGV